MAFDVSGNMNNAVRKIAADGTVTTLAPAGCTPFNNVGGSGSSPPGGCSAGSNDGSGTNAAFKFNIGQHGNHESFAGLVVDSAGTVYVSDTGNDAIRVITPDGTVSTLVAPSAGLNQPAHLTLDSVSGLLYVADYGNNAVKIVTVADGTVSTLVDANTPVGAGYAFNLPYGVALDGQGSLYVSDSQNSVIVKIDVSTGSVLTVAGDFGNQGGGGSGADGVGSAAVFGQPTGLAYSSGFLFVCDEYMSSVRVVYVQ
jgi:sugar lactone lactonase YvrE